MRHGRKCEMEGSAREAGERRRYREEEEEDGEVGYEGGESGMVAVCVLPTSNMAAWLMQCVW